MKNPIYYLIYLLLPIGFVSASAPDTPFYETHLSIIADAYHNASGGLKQGQVYSGLISSDISLDLQGLIGWNATTFYASAISITGGNPSDYSGDSQGISNIASENNNRIFELWLQHDFTAHQQLTIGFIDLNGALDHIDAAGLFLNSSQGIGPDFSQTGPGGPSIYPNTTFGMLWNSQFDEIALSFMVANAQAYRHIHISFNDGFLYAGEVNYKPEGGMGNFLSRVGLGVYSYNSKFSKILDPGHEGHISAGYYGILEKDFDGFFSNDDKLTAYLRYGASDHSYFDFKDYLGFGVVYENQSGGIMGVSLSQAVLGTERIESERMLGVFMEAAESIIDFSYSQQLLPWISVQPNIQYVINPGNSTELNNALVLSSRFSLSF